MVPFHTKSRWAVTQNLTAITASALVVELVLGAVDVAQRGSHTGSFCTATRRTDTYRGRKQPLSFELLELATG